MANAGALALARPTGGAVVPTVLGSRDNIRIPVGGKIRAGIKVLTKAAAKDRQVVDIYERGVREGLSFDAIARAIAEVAPDIKTALVPKNVPYFTVRPCDFPNPLMASEILAQYGEDRGEGLKLYRFPVIFPADQWQAVMPHQLQVWTASERRYWSEYSDDGKERRCMCYAPVSPGTRIFGGRKHTLRPDNNGICDPEKCPEYQRKHCNLAGRFIFYIPGIRSLAAIELATNSFYSMSAAIEKFETISFMRGGRLSGFLDAKKTPFYLTKVQKEVPHIDENGQAVRVKQWLIELEAPVDVSALIRAADEDEVINAGSAAVRAFGQDDDGVTATAEMPDDRQMPATMPSSPGGGRTIETTYSVATDFDADEDVDRPAASAPPVMSAPPSPATRASGTASKPAPTPKTGAAPKAAADDITMEDIGRAVESMKINPFEFQAYADKRYGSGWRVNVNARKRVYQQVEEARSNPAELIALVKAANN
jgi:hypothetical protein